MGMTNAMYDSQLMSNVVSTSYDTWTELLDNDKLLNEQYKVLAGRMPSAYNEVVVMVNKDNEISDYSLYCMGLMDSDELDDIMLFSSGFIIPTTFIGSASSTTFVI